MKHHCIFEFFKVLELDEPIFKYFNNWVRNTPLIRKQMDQNSLNNCVKIGEQWTPNLIISPFTALKPEMFSLESKKKTRICCILM